MATLATMFRRADAVLAAADPQWLEPTEQADPNRLRLLPWEDVYFHCKRIDNRRLVRQADPREGKRAWSAFAMFFLVTALFMALLAPKCLSMAAGVRLNSLNENYRTLEVERQRLDYEEARMLTPERLQQLADSLGLEQPSPDQIHRLNPRADNAVAQVVPVK